ncbi:hypothetical protein BKA70DRAFT_1342258 [Coprinopsis sp. MPI-PUGE-AT-0042]|nr:hypothetical protein BKA70DRAFT_1342258 [Coprinopsis sp. MPI-PUGE-AT-0042]
MSNTSPPVHRLPPEILVHIFRHLHATEEQPLDRNQWDTIHDESILQRTIAPYSVSSVCTYWDDISTLAPELWDNTRFLVSLDVHEGVSPAQMTLKYLQRAPHDEPFIVHIMCGESQKLVGRATERRRVAALIPILSNHFHRISEVFIITTFTTSLPPYCALFPSSNVPLNCGRLLIHTDEPRCTQVAPLAPWTASPSLQPNTPFIDHLDLSGSTFISYCRSLLQDTSELRQPQGKTLTIRSLCQDCPEAFRLEELLQLLEKVRPTLRELALVDVDLPLQAPLEAGGEALADDQGSTHPISLFIKRVRADTIAAILSSCHRLHLSPVATVLEDCNIPSPIDVGPAVSVQRLLFQSFSVSTILNTLHAIDPHSMLIMPNCDIGDGVELLQQLETVRNPNGRPLLENTVIVKIQGHGYIPLNALCQFSETRFGRDSSNIPRSQLRKLQIEPTFADWERMKADASERWVTQRVNEAGEEVMAWDIRGENFHLMTYDHATAGPTDTITVEFTNVTA